MAKPFLTIDEQVDGGVRMDLDRAGRLLDNYAKWVRDSFAVVEEDGCMRIISPMLNRHNDHMSIYLMEAPDGGLLLSDFGETIAGLSDGGCDLSTFDRKAKLSRVLAGYGLKARDGEIFVHTDEEGAAKAMSMLMQGMASVDDLFFTVRESATNFFEERHTQKSGAARRRPRCEETGV